MKLIHFPAPVLAIVAAGVWLRHQGDSLDDYQIRARDLKARLSQIPEPPPPTSSQLITEDDWIDFNQLAAVDQSPSQARSQQYLVKFLRHHQNATPLKIEDTLDQIPHLDLSENLARRIEASLLTSLAKHSPAVALGRIGNVLTSREHHLYQVQRFVFSKLAAQDPAQAAHWLDDQIAKNHLKAASLYVKNDPRFAFEAALIPHLAETNFANANARLSQFNAQEKRILFDNPQTWNTGTPPTDAFLKLARANLPENQVQKIVKSQNQSANHR